MKRVLFNTAFIFCVLFVQAQQGFTFIRISTEDNPGLATNVIHSLYPDSRGYLWVGTANGLQRFDGRKFTQIRTRAGSELMPYTGIRQILPLDQNLLLLDAGSFREIGVFDTYNFSYRRVRIKTKRPVAPQAHYDIWRIPGFGIFINVRDFGLLTYDVGTNTFTDRQVIRLPEGFLPAGNGYTYDPFKRQLWMVGKKGICVFDRETGEVWDRDHNPHDLPLLAQSSIRNEPTQIYRDRQSRFWIFNWPDTPGAPQEHHCFDSTGSVELQAATAGLTDRPPMYTEYLHFYESVHTGLWIYGVSVLFNWDEYSHRFQFSGQIPGGRSPISYERVNQLADDKDGNLWIATDNGLYFTSTISGSFSIVNYQFDDSRRKRDIVDIVEMPGKNYWFTAWGEGVLALDSHFQESKVPLYSPEPPAYWDKHVRQATRLVFGMCRQKATGKIWIGCGWGVLLLYDPATKKTDYFRPPESGTGTVRTLVEDNKGNLLFGTRDGRLIRYDGTRFRILQDFATAIYKLFIDQSGLLWVTTHEKGLFTIDPSSGKVLHNYSVSATPGATSGNDGEDVE